MAEKKKSKSIEEIITDMQSAVPKDFKTRIAKFEEFNKPENQHALRFQQYAEYTIFGKPSDTKNYPGAYNVAYQRLDKILKEDDDKIAKEDQVLEILNAYVDHFLEKAMGPRFKDAVKHAKDQGLTEDEVMAMKNTLLGNYLKDENGRPVGLLSRDDAKRLKGKTKMEVIEYLRDIGDKLTKSYSSHLMGKATENLIKHYDIADLSKHVGPRFEEAGFKPEDHYLTMQAQTLAQHYGALLRGLDISKLGYRKITKEKKEKK